MGYFDNIGIEKDAIKVATEEAFNRFTKLLNDRCGLDLNHPINFTNYDIKLERLQQEVEIIEHKLSFIEQIICSCLGITYDGIMCWPENETIMPANIRRDVDKIKLQIEELKNEINR